MWVELWVGVSGVTSGNSLKRMAGTTGLEPAASAVTGQRSNQLNYVPREGKLIEAKDRCGLTDSVRAEIVSYFRWDA